MKTGMWLLVALLPLLAGCNTDHRSEVVGLEKPMAAAASVQPPSGNYPERMRRAIT